MTIHNKQLAHQKTTGSRLFTGQIITTEDLRNFKTELIDEIKSISKEMIEQGSKKWLRSRDVLKILGISHGTLQNFRINGSLPYTKVGGVMFYDIDDINKMIESNRIDNTI